jgi:hypothetical protein
LPHEELALPVRHTPPSALPRAEASGDGPLPGRVPESAHVPFARQRPPIVMQFSQAVPPVPQAVSSMPETQLWVLSQQPLHVDPHALPASSPLSALPIVSAVELLLLLAPAPLLAPPPLPLLSTPDDEPPELADRSTPAPPPSVRPPLSPESAPVPAPPCAQAPRMTSPASTAAPIRMLLHAANAQIDHRNRMPVERRPLVATSDKASRQSSFVVLWQYV